ncbi:hypothetical protein ACFV4T_41275 [Streptomyces sp. NPDC059755]|uniref:hypothetical protein n=1 Tax=Streptomyces sp. NPDC059755 TaxID=3346934 RepID=UPI003668E8F0
MTTTSPSSGPPAAGRDMRKAGSKPAYLLFFEPRDARSFTVVDGCLRTVACFTNRPVTALRPRFPPELLELLDLLAMAVPPQLESDSTLTKMIFTCWVKVATS